ncbi:NHLP bacteriocin system secretion protein [Azospirillum griseum]|uniref:NHLP bacteriocin system secretion protein n=2 Tax=Azospirillum griseum TaxID=2496639 RepID=A0A3S0K6J0_9PROT|nr:NHLP bacteriocin system secretion protein [Azospirillum griseum]
MPDAVPPFRPQAVAVFTNGSDHRDALRVMRPRLWGLGFFLTTVILGILVWSAFFIVPVTVNGRGILLSARGVVDVVADASGQIHELNARPGDAVTPGMIIARIDQPELRLQLSIARGELDDALRFHTDLLGFQRRDAEARAAARGARLASLSGRLAALRERRDALIEQRDGVERLVARGTMTRERLIAASEAVLAVNGQIADAQDETAAIESEKAVKATQDEQARFDAERRVAEARRRVTGLEERLDWMGTVRSPFDGHVVEAKANIGQVVQPGTSILTVERTPNRKLTGAVDSAAPLVPTVVAYVRAADGKKLAPGMAVEVSPATTRREEHGFLLGRVISVGEMPASSDGMMRTLQNDRLVQTFVAELGTPFAVSVALDTDPTAPTQPLWSSSRTAPSPLASGTLADVRVTVRSTPLLALALPALGVLFDGRP